MNKQGLTYLFVLISIGFFYSSCKVQENKVKVKINHRSTKFLVNKLTNNEFKFNTLSGKAAISFDNGKFQISTDTIRYIQPLLAAY